MFYIYTSIGFIILFFLVLNNPKIFSFFTEKENNFIKKLNYVLNTSEKINFPNLAQYVVDNIVITPMLSIKDGEFSDIFKFSKENWKTNVILFKKRSLYEFKAEDNIELPSNIIKMCKKATIKYCDEYVHNLKIIDVLRFGDDAFDNKSIKNTIFQIN